MYLRVLLRGFGYTKKKPTEIWEDNASCIMMSENPTNRDRSRHVDVKVHYLRDLVRDGHVKLVKCAGTQNVSEPDLPSTNTENICGVHVSLFQLSLVLSILRLPL